MYSHRLGFSGTPDFVGIVDGIPTIIDYKIGSKVNRVNQLQIQSYAMLVQEVMNITIKRVCILLLSTSQKASPQFVEYAIDPQLQERVRELVAQWHTTIINPQTLHANKPVYTPARLQQKKLLTP